VRYGIFFEPSYARDLTLDRLDAYVAAQLNDGVMTFAYCMGWRVRSEILP